MNDTPEILIAVKVPEEFRTWQKDELIDFLFVGTKNFDPRIIEQGDANYIDFFNGKAFANPHDNKPPAWDAAPERLAVDNPDGLEPPELLASRLIDAWVAERGQIPWAKAIEISAIIMKMSDVERDRLLFLDDAPAHPEPARAVPDGWQPIETAPKDKFIFLAVYRPSINDYSYHAGSWNTIHERWHTGNSYERAAFWMPIPQPLATPPSTKEGE